jgi:hypothetical protein
MRDRAFEFLSVPAPAARLADPNQDLTKMKGENQ